MSWTVAAFDGGMIDVTPPIDGPDGTSLSTSDCWALLRDQPYGRLAVVGVDGPDIFPVNALVDHGSLVFRTDAGAKLTALDAEPRVAYEVDG
ncbi:MAG: pyridoxamine 5'-phosphate oxidase family protein, partial [Ilumatobacteraceae bacterium]